MNISFDYAQSIATRIEDIDKTITKMELNDEDSTGMYRERSYFVRKLREELDSILEQM